MLGVFFLSRQYALLSRGAYGKYVSTWLGEPASAASGGSRAAGERPGAIITKYLSASDVIWGFFIYNRESPTFRAASAEYSIVLG